MQVAGLDAVAVRDADAPDAGGGEVLQHRHAEAARADDEHRAARSFAWPRAPTSGSAICRE